MSQFWFPASPDRADAGSIAPVCPTCHSPVHRFPRRPQDRVVNWFVPVRRYRCRSLACKREFNLRVGHGDGRFDDTPAAYAATGPIRSSKRRSRPPASFVLAVTLAATGLLFVVLFAAAGWLDAVSLDGAYEAMEEWARSPGTPTDAQASGSRP